MIPRRNATRTRWLPAAALAAACAGAPAHAQEGDANRGRLLYENHCQECHTTRPHERDQRKANTPGEVRAWVGRWQATLELGWSASDVEDVATWLYLRYYDPERPRP